MAWQGKWKDKRRAKRLATYEQWAQSALTRDNNICQDCKIETVNLVVHHIDESRKLGYNNMNNSLDNLITLCRKCHAVRHGFAFKNPRYPLIKELRDQNKTLEEIGKYLGISRQRVWQILKVAS